MTGLNTKLYQAYRQKIILIGLLNHSFYINSTSNLNNMNSIPKNWIATARHHMLSLIALAVSTLALAAALVVVFGSRKDTVAVVRSTELIQGFKAMKDAQE